MAVRQLTSRGLSSSRRAHPAYVLAITAVAVWFWWLLGISQTSLGGLWPTSPPASTSMAEPKHAAAIAAHNDFKEAEQKYLDAQRGVDSAREALAITQRQWEEWLSAQAERDTLRSPTANRPATSVNPQYTAAVSALDQLKADLNALLEQMTPEHPDAQALAARVAALEQQVAQMPQFIAIPENSPVQSSGQLSLGASISDRAAPTDAERDRLSVGAAPKLGADNDPGAAGVRAAWDSAQETLHERIRVAQQCSDRLETLRRQGADRVPAEADLNAAAESIQPLSSHSPWSMGAALAILAAIEAVALRLAWTLAAAPSASAPLASVEQVAALLPLPVFAALPASGHSRPLAPQLTDDGLSPSTLWLLACEGSLAAMLFLFAAMTSQNIGFPADFLLHPIEAIARGLSGLHP